MSASWWGADVVPRIRWRIIVDRIRIIGKEGDAFIPGYGIAYYLGHCGGAVLYPVPLNLIIGGVRVLWWHMRCPPWRFEEYKLDKARLDCERAWDAGYARGASVEQDLRGNPYRERR